MRLAPAPPADPSSGTEPSPGMAWNAALAAMLYDLLEVGYAHPDLGRERKCEPADWWDWSDRQLWTKPGA
jgi:hypothetical protein